MANEIKKIVKDLGDAVKEGVHKGNADAERATRAEYGDVMTPREKGESVVREGSEEVKAGIDSAKRKARDMT